MNMTAAFCPLSQLALARNDTLGRLCGGLDGFKVDLGNFVLSPKIEKCSAAQTSCGYGTLAPKLEGCAFSLGALLRLLRYSATTLLFRKRQRHQLLTSYSVQMHDAKQSSYCAIIKKLRLYHATSMWIRSISHRRANNIQPIVQ
jgi:hypothetical protein